jgi:plastocyanin
MKKLLLIFIAGLVLFTGCTYGNQSTGNTQAQTGPAQTVPNTVTIKDFAFTPSTMTVKAGTTVAWTNLDSAPHTIVSDSGGEISSETLSNGQSYTHTFNTQGTFKYHCGIHSSMKGTIIVE